MTNPIELLQSIIRNRTCVVLSKGKSLDHLEHMIHKLQDYDICWVGQNRTDYIEEKLLNPIDKQIDLVVECATVFRKESYESEYRLPRLTKFLERERNLLLTSELVLDECFRIYGPQILEKYKDKIVTIDSLFSLPNVPKKVWEPPSNSLTLLLCFLIAGQARKIILCGVDGFISNDIDIFNTYYQSEIVAEERMRTFKNAPNFKGSVPADTNDFNLRFPDLLALYQKAYNNGNVEIVNCSPKSIIKVFRKIDYNELEQELI